MLFIDESTLVSSLWSLSNNAPFLSYSLKEVSLSGNMGIDEMHGRKIDWLHNGPIVKSQEHEQI